MITFQNINTQHVFILPDKQAFEIINQAPDIYKIISGVEQDLLIEPAALLAKADLTNDIYNLVVVSDSDSGGNASNSTKKVVKKSAAKRKTSKRKITKSKKKEK